MRTLGVHGKVGVWLGRFLFDRFQTVTCAGHQSTKAKVTSGVPQGTVLGPVLFLILILDIATNVSRETKVGSFADDTRVSRGMKSTADPIQLQEDLQTVYTWAEEVNMVFNGDKFECLRYWPNEDIGNVFKAEFIYTDPKGEKIVEKDSLRDLGVEMSSNLSFSIHINKITTSCRKLTGWALRTFRSRNKVVMLTIWKSLIQSILDYCSQLWSPYSAADIGKLEDVQRSFTSRIDGMTGLNYWQRLKALNLYSQERRRDRYAIIFIWKVAMGQVDGYNLDFTPKTDRRGRECRVKPVPRNSPPSVRKARENSLAVKGAKMFNMLPPDIRNTDSEKVHIFKTKLDRFLRNIPDQPTIQEEGRAAETNSLLHQIPMSRR